MVRAGAALRTVEGLVDCAKRALAAAKRRGRDRVQLFADLTVEDLVAEEPEAVRLARALALSSGARATSRTWTPSASRSWPRPSPSNSGWARPSGLAAGSQDCSRHGHSRVPDRVLALLGPTLPADQLAYEAHASAGERMVRSVAGVSEVAEIVGAHEERFDGTGYPRGLSGMDIPVESRIVACAAAHVKLSQILTGDALAQALGALAGGALDPEVVTATLERLARERSHPRRAPARRAGRLASRALSYPRQRWPTRCSSARCASGRSRSAIASSRPRTRRRSSRTACRLTTSSPTTRHGLQGGAGLICIEATAVHPSGLLTGHTIAGYDPRVVERLARVAAAAHAGGARLFAQLFHGGREQIDLPPRAPAVAPSAIPSQRFKVEPRALGAAEIEEIIEHHELVAGNARDAGLDGVELCASHGYLPTQFLSERTNRRDDAWGGDGERRMRYVREALMAMRRGAGDGLAVGIRLSADETLPEGRHAPETAAILRVLADEGLIDYASTVIGDSSSYLGSAWIVPPPPIARDAMREPATILRTGLPVPLIATSRIHEPVEAEALLAAGAADAVGMTRALIADPELPRRLADGDEVERILCTGCNQGCIGHYHLGLPISCLQNPRTGQGGARRRARAADGLPRARDRRRARRYGRRRGGGRAGATVTLVEAGSVAGRPVRPRRPRPGAP